MMLATFEAFRAHAAAAGGNEACGLILRVGGEEAFQPCRNVSEHPAEEFQVSEDDWASAEDRGEVLAVCHSHPGGDPMPGPADLEACREHGLPWFILGAGDGLQRVDPFPEPLLGRPFVYGWADCYSLVRDWHLQFGVRLPDFPREPDFWEKDRSPYLEHFEACGFRLVNDLKDGDLVLMRIASRVPNHAGIHLGGRILHHLMDRQSTEDLYGDGLRAATTHVLRRCDG